ncbi:MAG: VTT domain-containing protein [Oscillospiraceae bacterium]|nr:VTT domain-containing protein [Oscillospiraceae bacterium]
MKWLIRLLPLVGMVAVIVIAATQVEDWSVEGLLRMTPRNPWAAVGLMLLFFAFKSLSFVFPILVIQMASGLLFPLPAALAVNLAGMLISALLPYGIGRFSGGGAVEKLVEKYPKLQKLTGLYQGRELFFSYLLRVVGVPPMDVASLLLGAMKLRPVPYLLGSMLGFLPMTVAATVMGANISRPGSPAFILSVTAWVAIIVISILIYRHASKAKKAS